jgi:hypothetical protein
LIFHIPTGVWVNKAKEGDEAFNLVEIVVVSQALRILIIIISLPKRKMKITKNEGVTFSGKMKKRCVSTLITSHDNTR